MRTRFKLILLLVALFVFQGIAADSDYDWKLVRDQDGVQVYLKKIWADDIKSFRGVIEINSSLDSLLAVIVDINACTEWVHRCKAPALLLKKSFTENYHYQIHKLPFPAKDREFIFHSKIVRSPDTGVVQIEMHTEPEFCTEQIKACTLNNPESLVRVQHSHGHYLLEPLNRNKTRVTWTHHTNPGGHLPLWLVNTLIKEMPFQTLKGLRKKVLEEKYQKAQMVLNPMGDITQLITQN